MKMTDICNYIRQSPFPKRQILDFSKLKDFADDNFGCDENRKKVLLKAKKHCWEKEKLLITSNFSFSCSVFKRLVLQTCKNHGLFWKGLILLLSTQFNGLFCVKEDSE